MKKIIKAILKAIIPNKTKQKIEYIKLKNRNLREKGKFYKGFYILRYLLTKHFLNNKVAEQKRLVKLYRKITPTNLPKDKFIYFLNPNYIFDYSFSNFSNGTLDYSLVLNHSLNELKNITKDQRLQEEIDAVSNVCKIIAERNKEHDCSHFLLSMIEHKPSCLKDALQRVLLVNQILWQTNHSLIGLGRMDKYLAPFMSENEEEDESLLYLFFDALHKDYKVKSGELFGDTGQVIILGGLEKDGSYFSNRLTYDILKTCMKYNQTDPKIFMRVSMNMPDDLLRLCCKSMRLGNGSPLLSNDHLVIKCLDNFGYQHEDCYDYICSACWEPFPEGLAVESNNELPMNFLVPFVDTLDDLTDEDDKNTILEKYKNRLKPYLETIADKLIHKEFSDDLISSIFNKQCLEKGKTIREKGPKYNNIGCTGVGLGNVINSICAIEYVKKNTEYSVTDYIKIVKNNFENQSELLNKIKENASCYCVDEDDYISLTNDLVVYTSDVFKGYDTKDRKIKFGLSSPNYILGYENLSPTPDGRKLSDPMIVHISSSKGLPYSEIVNFASKLNYCTRCFNGNVVDLMISPSFIDNDFDKFVTFIKLSIKKGFFQLQSNVVDSKTLIDAKKHPENYQSLIVRVWGFSAYFVELPENFQDLMIKRAIENESINK